MRYPVSIEKPIDFPPFYHVRIRYPESALADPVGELDAALDCQLDIARIQQGDRVGIGVGSRGITMIDTYVKVICSRLRNRGAIPFIIPAMGSHGKATAKGQEEVLRQLKLSDCNSIAPVLSSMDTTIISHVFKDVPVHFSKDALMLDHSICINRIKPHTKFKGPMESGIYKMLCVGMGKHRGAMTYHTMALKYGFYELLKAMGDEIINAGNFRFAVAVVEDFLDQPAAIEVIGAADIYEREKALLSRAKALFPRLPVNDVNVLVIQRIGKEISGSGMDPNVTGRTYDFMEDDFSESLRADRVVVLNLSEKTMGNGIGLGNADIITEKVYRSLDYEATLMNALTSISLRKAFIPVRLPTDRAAIQAGFVTIGPIPPQKVRAIIIKDTAHVSEFWVSQALLPEIHAMENAEILGERQLAFDSKDNIIGFNLDLT